MSEDSSQTPSAAGEAPAKTSFSELLFFAFGLAIDGCIQNGLVGDIEEETTTGALMGAMAAHAPWCYAVWSEVESAMPYAWAHYRKRGGAGVSETLTGADFALLLRVGPQEFRAAVFQAKRSVNLDGGFKTVQISPAIGELPPQPQLVRLLEYAGTIEEKLQKNRKRPGWVHYLIYCHDEINFLSLSKISPHCDDVVAKNKLVCAASEAHRNKGKGFFSLKRTRREWRGFSSILVARPPTPWKLLLNRGLVTAPGKSAAGWLTLKGENVAASFVRATCPHMDVFEGAPESGYRPLFKDDKSVEVKETVLSTINRALLDSSPNTQRLRRARVP